MSDTDFSQLEMVHRLPPASLVDRFDYLCELATGRRVVHIGFVDAGCQTLNEQSGVWLHEHLSRTASELIGLDLDTAGVEDARRRGYDAHVVDCRDVAAVRALGLPPLNTTLARRLMERTKIFSALGGVRGRQPVNLVELEKLLVRFSFLVTEQKWIKEIDINPLLASARACFCVWQWAGDCSQVPALRKRRSALAKGAHQRRQTCLGVHQSSHRDIVVCFQRGGDDLG